MISLEVQPLRGYLEEKSPKYVGRAGTQPTVDKLPHARLSAGQCIMRYATRNRS